MTPSDTKKLAEAVCGGDRRALGRAITLMESIRDDLRIGAVSSDNGPVSHRQIHDDHLNLIVAFESG